MYDGEYQRMYFKQRYAQDPEFRRHRREVNNAYRRRRYADDAEYRRCEARAARAHRIRQRYRITIDQYEGALTSQNGTCAACGTKLGRIKRVDSDPVTGAVTGLLCTPCFNDVATLRHVLAHAAGFEAYFRKWNMTAARHRLAWLLRRLGRPAQRWPTSDVS
jgi:hypothetical protein